MPIENWSDDILIATLGDEPLFSEDMGLLMQRLDGPDEASPSVIVDLKDVTYLNSSNIAQLVHLRKTIQKVGGRLRICSAQDPVWSILMLTNMDKLFEFTDDVATSLASLQIESS